MSVAEIVRALGGAHRSGEWWRCICPVHGSRTGRSASLALRDGDQTLIVKCWAGCHSHDVLAALRRLGLFDSHAEDHRRRPQSAEMARRNEAETRDRQRRIGRAHDILASSLPTEGTPVERYLRMRLPGIEAIPPVIRYLPMGDAYARHPPGGWYPVMVVPVEREDGVVGAHRTWIRPDGAGKVSLDPVRISTGLIRGGAVRLVPAAETLLVGEGVESCLAAMTATSMPAWAALSTSGLTALVLPASVRIVVILADHDANGAGERAARTAAARWLAEGRRVKLAMPRDPGTDIADVLVNRDHVESTEPRNVAA